MEVELVSKDCIKPSSPTPQHLKTHNLTLLDQLAPFMFFKVFLVYPFSQEAVAKTVDEVVVSRRTLQLKESLSQALTHYYPLAGALRDEVSIDCNDQGTYYVEARAKSPLPDYLSQLEAGLLVKFLPLRMSSDVSGSHVTMFQQTNFACGGMVIGAAVCHVAADAASFISFLKAWAFIASALNHEASENLYPNYVSNSAIFGSHYNEVLPREFTVANTFSHLSRTRLITSKRLVFHAAAISRLKREAASSSLGNPTRVEVVSALLWRRFAAVFKTRRSGVHKPLGLTHIVNLRRRASQLFSDNSPGNICWIASPICTSDDPDLSGLASQVREATSKIDGEMVKEITGDQALTKICQMQRELRNKFSNELDYISFGSWCNFGIYDIDFGWGKPVKAGDLVGIVGVELPFPEGAAILMDTRTGKGVDAMVSLDEQDMLMLEHDQELLSYALLDPMISLTS